MKIRLFFLSLILFVGISANAQFKKYVFGLKAAPQISWMKPSADKYEGNGAKLGFSWGFVSEFNFTENHCFATGFNVVFNGGKLKFPFASDTIIGTMKRNYGIKSIEIPITLKMRTNTIGNMKFYGQIGFGTSFRFAAKNTDEFVHGSTTVKTEKKNYDNTSFIRESLIIGLGAEYNTKAGTILSTGLAFNNGFSDILTGKNTVIPSTKEKSTLNFIELNVAVLF